MVADTDVGESVSDFLFSGKGKIVAIRVVREKGENGDFVYELCVSEIKIGKATTITAKKESRHKTLVVEYPDGTTESVSSSVKDLSGSSETLKEHNLRKAMTIAVNHLY
ncbi:hypothetical protein [Clostridium beijerinckii]|uniref:hypothetical protein n=1 Tax=Clostridium beijerinckii TaxID=1520 RepID=UPI00136188CE|nr:hypothetical protein [Clostridium beijerinckii]MZK49029.1 hypothetical protein [Clostridium beijerinckii]MZK57404.1 hypothetical protein [Clostridium beijerinckii]MZK67615.1 hypothetical protein [Clostridium beijerinckii]MZK72700.1 hypothetical protein [Clostridium beijerinckii]MZK82296.1 hypothetical protein [Clostridium beijerinckii]